VFWDDDNMRLPKGTCMAKSEHVLGLVDPLDLGPAANHLVTVKVITHKQ
jgi:hypothetical protein